MGVAGSNRRGENNPRRVRPKASAPARPAASPSRQRAGNAVGNAAGKAASPGRAASPAHGPNGTSGSNGSLARPAAGAQGGGETLWVKGEPLHIHCQDLRPCGEALRATIPSDFDHAHVVQQRILGGVQHQGFNPKSHFAVQLALDEAMVNAIKHGNRLDRAKQVHVEAFVTPDRVEICIEDEGPGFTRSCVPDPTAAENLLKCSGRGILLIEAYMDQVEWDRGGRRLRMVRLNGPDELPRR